MSDYEQNNETLEQEHTEEQSTQDLDTAKLEEELRSAQRRIEELNKENMKRRLKEKELREKEEQFGEVDVDEYRRLKQEREEAERRKLEEKGEWDKVRERLVENHQSEINKLKDALAEKDKMIERTLIDNTLSTAINKFKGDADLLMPHVRDKFRLQQTDRGFEVSVVEDDGTPAVDYSTGKPIGVEDYVKKLREHEKYGRLFDYDGPSGAATTSAPAQGKAPVDPSLRKSQMSQAQIKEYVAKYNYDAFKALPE